MTFTDIHSLLLSHFGQEKIIGTDENATPKAIQVQTDAIEEVAIYLHGHEQLYFDMLSCVTGIDNGQEANTMEVVYNLYSVPYSHALMVKVLLDRGNPTIASLSHIWQAANWHEREAYDLLGIHFTGHPDLRRILLPADWEGHPLRKDYTAQEYYHGVQVKY